MALGILWLHCARAAGWEAFGIDFPGHFMIALPGGGSQLVLDVFDGGQPMDARALRALVKRVEGPKAELRPGLLQPMGARAVLLRLQNNLKIRRLDAGDLTGAVAAVDDMLRIAPDHASLWREAASDQPTARPCRGCAALLRAVSEAGARGRGSDSGSHRHGGVADALELTPR